jgi:hypothetical protein
MGDFSIKLPLLSKINKTVYINSVMLSLFPFFQVNKENSIIFISISFRWLFTSFIIKMVINTEFHNRINSTNKAVVIM